MRKRLGLYSGRIYVEGDDYSLECCKVITEEQATDEKWLNDQRLVNSFKCMSCGGCPLSRGKTTYDENEGDLDL
jgi:hypothetical protein